MNNIWISTLLMVLLAIAKSSEASIEYYNDDELITKFNVFREKYANMYKDIEIDAESKDSSLAELKRLLNDIDTFSSHVDFETTYKNTYNSPS